MQDSQRHSSVERRKSTTAAADTFPFCASYVPLWVLFLMFLLYVTNQMDRYIIAVVTQEMQIDLGFGDGQGGGTEYAVLAGPVFTNAYCLALMPIGYIADRYNKVRIISAALFIWSVATASMGFCNAYWQLVALRLLKAFSQAAGASLATGIISDNFPLHTRGTAIGIFNCGIPVAQALVYGPGNVLTDSVGWRLAVIYLATPGIVLALLIVLTVKNIEAVPVAKESDVTGLQSRTSTTSFAEDEDQLIKDKPDHPKKQKYVSISELLTFFWKHQGLKYLTFAGCFRMTSGVVWIYYTNVFFQNFHGLTQTEISYWMSWIPLASGVTGAAFFGYVSDRASRRRGAAGRILVLAVTCAINVPFTVGALYLSVPYAFISMLIAGFFSGFWVPGCVAVIVHIVPAAMRVSAVALFLFVTTITGGNAPILEPLLQTLFRAFPGNQQRFALTVLYPIVTFIASVLFCVTYWFQKRNQRNEENTLLKNVASTDDSKL